MGCKPTFHLSGAVVIFAALLAGCGGGSGHGSSGATTSTTPRSAVPEAARSLLAPQRFPQGAESEQTDPAVTPRSGAGSARFVVSVTARTRLGAVGPTNRVYRIVLQGPEPRCRAFTEIDTGSRGDRIRIVLQPPIHFGWCPGRHDGTVVLLTTTRCLPPSRHRPPCRLRPAREVAVGNFSFIVR